MSNSELKKNTVFVFDDGKRQTRQNKKARRAEATPGQSREVHNDGVTAASHARVVTAWLRDGGRNRRISFAPHVLHGAPQIPHLVDAALHLFGQSGSRIIDLVRQSIV